MFFISIINNYFQNIFKNSSTIIKTSKNFIKQAKTKILPITKFINLAFFNRMVNLNLKKFLIIW